MLALVALACLISASAIGGRTPAEEFQDDPGRKRPFIHKDHVASVWASRRSPENQRDCRGCHVFDEGGARDPQAVCVECHISAEANRNTFRPVFEQGWDTLDNYRDAERPFRHHTHAALACRECHQPEDRIPSDPMPIRGGSAECTRCHGPSETGEPVRFDLLWGEADVASDSVRRAFLDALNRSPNMLPDQLGPFSHSEHLADPKLGFGLEELVGEGSKRGLCTSCHDPLVHSGVRELHENRFRRTSCGECHVSASGPLEFGATKETAHSLAAMTFSHADHLGYERGVRDPASSSGGGYERIEQGGCHACHEYDSGARTFVVSDAATHESCRECHTSESWRVAQHGDWQGWGCLQCHSFDRAGGLALDRPRVTVRRRRAEHFVIESQVHPHIAGEVGTELFDDNCSQCHRARVEELPSRLGTRAFSHATHLPPEPDAEQCALCHGSRVARADSSSALTELLRGQRIAASDPELSALLGLTYDTNACTQCHRGAMPKPVQIEYDAIQPAEVVDFSHAHHVGKQGPAGSPIDCLTCHQPDDEAAGPVGTLATAMACTQCHDHREGPTSEISGDASAAELHRCSKCHVGTIPAASGSLDVERARLTRLLGNAGQFHPSDRRCDECHKAEWSSSVAELVAGDHVFAEGGRHRDGTLVDKHQHRGKFLKDLAGVDCLWCHWAQGVPNHDFESADLREKNGNVLERRGKDGVLRTFPGGSYREQFGR
jgi:hypothetical protein